MLDIRFIREHPALVQEGARKKRINIDIDALLEVDERRRQLIGQVENLKALRNKMSKEIPTLQGEARQAAIAQMKSVADESKTLEGPLREAEASFADLMLRVPNVPADDVPEGESDADNVAIKTWGTMPQFDFTPRDHVDARGVSGYHRYPARGKTGRVALVFFEKRWCFAGTGGAAVCPASHGAQRLYAHDRAASGER